MQTWNEFEKEISAISDVEKEHIKQTARLVSQIVQQLQAFEHTKSKIKFSASNRELFLCNK